MDKSAFKIALIGCWGYGNIGDDTYPKLWTRAFPEVEFSLFNSDLPSSFPDADLYLFGGGGIVYDNGSAHASYMLAYAEHAVKRGIPFALSSVGIQARSDGNGGYVVKDTLATWGPYLRKAAGVSVRDAFSQEHVTSLGVAAQLAPDLCYLVEGVSPSADYFITVVPATGCSPRYPKFHSKLQSALTQYPNCALVVMNMGAEVKGDNYIDEIASKYPVMASFKTQHLTPEMAVEIIRMSQFVLTGRFHGLVFSRAARKNYWIPEQGATLKLDQENLTSDIREALLHVELVAQLTGIEHNMLPPENFR